MIHCQSSRNYATDRKDFPQCPVMAAVYDCSANIAPNALFTFCSCVYRAMILLMVLMWCCRCISSSPGTITVSGVTWRPGRGNHGHPAPASAAAGDVHTMEAERRIHGWKS